MFQGKVQIQILEIFQAQIIFQVSGSGSGSRSGPRFFNFISDEYIQVRVQLQIQVRIQSQVQIQIQA